MHLHFYPLRGHFDPPRQGPMVDPMTHHPKPLPLVLLHQARLIFALPTEFFQEKQKKNSKMVKMAILGHFGQL